MSAGEDSDADRGEHRHRYLSEDGATFLANAFETGETDPTPRKGPEEEKKKKKGGGFACFQRNRSPSPTRHHSNSEPVPLLFHDFSPTRDDAEYLNPFGNEGLVKSHMCRTRTNSAHSFTSSSSPPKRRRSLSVGGGGGSIDVLGCVLAVAGGVEKREGFLGTFEKFGVKKEALFETIKSCLSGGSSSGKEESSQKQLLIDFLSCWITSSFAFLSITSSDFLLNVTAWVQSQQGDQYKALKSLGNPQPPQPPYELEQPAEDIFRRKAFGAHNAEEIANGVCYLFHTQYKNIAPCELVNLAQEKDISRAPNVTHLRGREENFSFLCLVEMVFSAENDEERVSAMKKCVNIASLLVEMGNYAGFCAAMNAITHKLTLPHHNLLDDETKEKIGDFETILKEKKEKNTVVPSLTPWIQEIEKVLNHQKYRDLMGSLDTPFFRDLGTSLLNYSNYQQKENNFSAPANDLASLLGENHALHHAETKKL